METGPSTDDLLARIRSLEDEINTYRYLVDNSPDSISLTRLSDGTYIDINRGFTELAGYEPDEIIGKTSIGVGIWANLEDRQRVIDALVEVGRVDNMEAEFVLKSGEHKFGLLSARITEIDGEKLILSVVRDISAMSAAREELRHSEELNRLLLNQLGGIVWTVDSDLRITSARGAGLTQLELAADEPVGRSLQDFLRDNDESNSIVAAARDALDGSSSTCDFRFNNVVWRSHVSPLQVEDGGIIGAIGISLDITERSRTEDIITAFFDQSPLMLAVADMNSLTPIRVSRALESATGWSAGELQDGSPLDAIHPDDREDALRIRDTLFAGKPVLEHRLRYITDDGEARTVELAMVSDLDRGVVYVTAYDITHRVRAETELNESRRMLSERNAFIEAILDNLPIGLSVHDSREGKTIYINQRFEEIYGWPQSDLTSVDRFFECVYPDPDYRKEVETRIRQDMESGDPERMEWRDIRITTRSGDTRYVYAKNIPLADQNLMISTVQDVTDRVVSERQQVDLERQLNVSRRLEAMGRLAGGVAHDLNNFLTPILGYADLGLEQLAEDTPHRESLEHISTAAAKARDLVSQLLAFGRQQTLEYRALRVEDVLNHIEPLMRRTIREDIHLQITHESSLPPVMADQGQIEQVIMNLVVNASDAMPQGGKLSIETSHVTVDETIVSSRPGWRTGDFVMLTIGDTGAGIDEETITHIFEPFFSTKNEGGTGLGLASVYGIVRQHGGNIWVHSEVGHGSTFEVYLPVSHSPTASIDRTDTQPADLRGSENVLLVEDNDPVRNVARELLERYGYSVVAVSSGEEALAYLSSGERRVDLLVTDIIMPGMNGKELFQRLATRSPLTRVVYMSGYAQSVISQLDSLNESEDFIQKPFAVRDLLAKVRQVLDRRPDRPS